jgi:hypothetical protein
MAQLANDREFVRREARKKARRDFAARKLRQNERPLIKDLRAAGANIDSVWDLVNSRRPYAHLIHVLLKHLPRKYDVKIREGIARALTVREARGVAVQPIIEELIRSDADTE